MRLLFALLLAPIGAWGDATDQWAHPYSAYPPGCLTTPALQDAMYAPNVHKFFERRVLLANADKPASTNMDEYVRVIMSTYRVACAEPNRSVILVQFRLDPEFERPDRSRFVLPQLETDSGPFGGPWLALLPEPGAGGTGLFERNGLVAPGDYSMGWDDPKRFVWTYVLDNPVPGDWRWIENFYLSPEDYNNAFNLVFYGPGEGYTVIPVPATRDVLQPNERLPLNGRLSGNWVAEGARDQGVILSFANKVLPGQSALGSESSPLLLFLSWYTYDAAGDLLWLTGAAEFPQGANQVTVPIEHVVDGRFMQSRRAHRTVIGEVTLTAINCNDLRMDFVLDGLQLGTGSRRLSRIGPMEIAGYTCRDYDGRAAP